MFTVFVLSAVIAAAAIVAICTAVNVVVWRGTSKQASKLRSMTSMQGELIEIRDYIAKVDAWVKRISMREVMRERREDERNNGAQPPRSSKRAFAGPLTKDELRVRAGIVAGQPVKHSEDH